MLCISELGLKDEVLVFGFPDVWPGIATEAVSGSAPRAWPLLAVVNAASSPSLEHQQKLSDSPSQRSWPLVNLRIACAFGEDVSLCQYATGFI